MCVAAQNAHGERWTQNEAQEDDQRTPQERVSEHSLPGPPRTPWRETVNRTVGTRLAEAGVNEAVAAAYLGHTDITTTAKFYQRIRAEVLRDTVEKLRRTGTE